MPVVRASFTLCSASPGTDYPPVQTARRCTFCAKHPQANKYATCCKMQNTQEDACEHARRYDTGTTKHGQVACTPVSFSRDFPWGSVVPLSAELGAPACRVRHRAETVQMSKVLDSRKPTLDQPVRVSSSSQETASNTAAQTCVVPVAEAAHAPGQVAGHSQAMVGFSW